MAVQEFSQLSSLFLKMFRFPAALLISYEINLDEITQVLNQDELTLVLNQDELTQVLNLDEFPTVYMSI